MENEFIYSSQFIWKQTALDGLLPITNFTEGMKEEEHKKRGKSKEKGKDLGVITDFSTSSDDLSKQSL